MNWIKENRMKKNENIFSEFEALARENAKRLYAAAYAVKGEREGAETLCEDILFYGAKRSLELVNKGLVIDLMLEKIGKGSHEGTWDVSFEEILARAVARADKWYRKKKMLTRVGIGVAVLLLCVGIALPFIPQELMSRTDNVILMENAKVIMGDNEKSELVNYQNVMDNISMNEEHIAKYYGVRTIMEYFTAITAPDGTPYAVVNNLETSDGSNTTFTLYRGYKGGWDSVGTAELGANIDQFGFLANSDLYIYADKDSDVYVFNRIGTEVNIYKYDSDIETFEKKQTFPFRELSFYFTICVEFDMDMGEKGVAYIACNWAGSVKVWRYDVASDTLSVICENVELATPTVFVMMTVQNDTVYIASGNGPGMAYPTLFRIRSDGAVDSVQLSTWKEYFCDIEIAQNGTIHLIGRQQGYTHYIVSADFSTVNAAELEKSCYEDTDYALVFLGLFRGNDGNVHILENYQDSEGGEACYLVYARLSDTTAGKAVFVNGFDMLDNHYQGGYMRMNGKDVIFPTYAYHDTVEPYIVYFRINELEANS